MNFMLNILLGNEVQLKLRLSSTLSDVKLSVYSKDSIFACKKKLQVSNHTTLSSYLSIYRLSHKKRNFKVHHCHVYTFIFNFNHQSLLHLPLSNQSVNFIYFCLVRTHLHDDFDIILAF